VAHAALLSSSCLSAQDISSLAERGDFVVATSAGNAAEARVDGGWQAHVARLAGLAADGGGDNPLGQQPADSQRMRGTMLTFRVSKKLLMWNVLLAAADSGLPRPSNQ